MKTITFKIEINAPIKKVWNTLWNDDTYSVWTQHFNPGSYYESDWKVYGVTKFLGPEQNGVASTITKLEIPTEVIFNHLADINKGVEGDNYGEGGFEKYELSENNNITTLVISVDVKDEYEQIMNVGYSNGLKEIKRIAEMD